MCPHQKFFSHAKVTQSFYKNSNPLLFICKLYSCIPNCPHSEQRRFSVLREYIEILRKRNIAIVPKKPTSRLIAPSSALAVHWTISCRRVRGASHVAIVLFAQPAASRGFSPTLCLTIALTIMSTSIRDKTLRVSFLFKPNKGYVLRRYLRSSTRTSSTNQAYVYTPSSFSFPLSSLSLSFLQTDFFSLFNLNPTYTNTNIISRSF